MPAWPLTSLSTNYYVMAGAFQPIISLGLLQPGTKTRHICRLSRDGPSVPKHLPAKHHILPGHDLPLLLQQGSHSGHLPGSAEVQVPIVIDH